VSAGYWFLGLTFVAVVVMRLGDPYAARLHLGDGVGLVALGGGGLAAALFVLGTLHALVSARTRGVGAAFLGLVLCALLVLV
jgi:hypothetical protein